MEQYVIISGGELFNKGAQAMTFVTVCEIRKRCPNAIPVLFSERDYKRTPEEKENYHIEFLPAPGLGEALSLTTGLLCRKYRKRQNGKNFDMYQNIFKNAIAWIDISGYALGSNWGTNIALAYIRRIYLAQRYRIPIYLMPQSFGPLEFEGRKARLVHLALRRYLPYCKCIMAREPEGKRLLETTYGLKNVILTSDLVLQSSELDLSCVYKTIPAQRRFDISPESVAIIPNAKNIKYGNRHAINALYCEMIDYLLSINKKVYFIYHAVEDLQLAKEIKKERYADVENVRIVEEELSCIEFCHIVSMFNFVIASRYHSIVHAYKEGVPAIVLGWATKYRELMKGFGQNRFFCDVREDINNESVMCELEWMCDNYQYEAECVAAGMKKLRVDNVYDRIAFKEM